MSVIVDPRPLSPKASNALEAHSYLRSAAPLPACNVSLPAGDVCDDFCTWAAKGLFWILDSGNLAARGRYPLDRMFLGLSTLLS